MNFTIDNSDIEKSFDDIAKKLLLSHVISVNDTDIELTEIEFYYFHEKIHPDNYTHPHERPAGQWRLHNKGIDITFDGTEKEHDGGILIRGVRSDQYVNGPIKSLKQFFEAMSEISSINQIALKPKELSESEIIKTFRHLPNKIQFEDFHLKKYRYLKDIDRLSLSKATKDRIKADHKKV